MHQEQRNQTRDLLRERGIDYALFSKPATVTWLTGFAPPVQVGPNLFASGNPLLWYDDGQFTLITVDAHTSLAAPFGTEPDGRVVTYQGYTVDAPIAGGKGLIAAFDAAAKARLGRVGIEREFVSDLVSGQLPHDSEMIPIDGWLEPLRMIKNQEELSKLRRNFALTDIGHAAARKAVQPGSREIDVWNAFHAAIQAAAGCRVPVGNDCVVGYREQNIGGWPEDKEIRLHDSVIVDISVVLDGYWSDSCATYYAGDRTPQQQKLHQVITDALDYTLSLLRPGAVAREIDEKVRAFIHNAGCAIYPHHTGHGLGVSGHEAPRITPYNDEVLQPGMVIAVEPGTYIPGELGVRLEDVVLITPDGPELLTHHDKS